MARRRPSISEPVRHGLRPGEAMCRPAADRKPAISPASAINTALSEARGELIGVMIDGAQMASPGLLAGALSAAKVTPRAVIASLGFHLGPEVQMQSVAKGYNQAVEDDLLESTRWYEDGYRLFDISVFAGSSAAGWFQPISESNARVPDDRPMAQTGRVRRIVRRGRGRAGESRHVRARTASCRKAN